MLALIKSTTLAIVSAVLDAGLLTAGWLWARHLISIYQRREGFLALGNSSRGSYYEFWALSFPSYVTALASLACAAATVILLWRRRHFVLIAAYVGYLILLGVMWIVAFAGLGFDAFD